MLNFPDAQTMALLQDSQTMNMLTNLKRALSEGAEPLHVSIASSHPVLHRRSNQTVIFFSFRLIPLNYQIRRSLSVEVFR
jgi:hypothetical protein